MNIPDTLQESAFDEAVVGVDAIAHTASPTWFPDDKHDPSGTRKLPFQCH